MHWRRPSLVILYTKHAIDPAELDLVSARGSHDANVIVRMPGDRSVFPFRALEAQIQGNDVPLADPLQQIWDLQDLGGADRLEAAGSYGNGYWHATDQARTRCKLSCR